VVPRSRGKLQASMRDVLIERGVHPKSGSVGCDADIVMPSEELASSFWQAGGAREGLAVCQLAVNANYSACITAQTWGECVLEVRPASLVTCASCHGWVKKPSVFLCEPLNHKSSIVHSLSPSIFIITRASRPSEFHPTNVCVAITGLLEPDNHFSGAYFVTSHPCNLACATPSVGTGTTGCAREPKGHLW